MNDPKDPYPGSASRDEIMAALFAQMVLQQANMAMMLLGKVPHPKSGETIRDIEAASLFIDQLEMLETKTRGNLSKDEENLLRQSLTSLRMAFVEAIDKPASAPDKPGATPTPTTSPADAAKPAAETAESDAESRKKFSKKY